MKKKKKNWRIYLKQSKDVMKIENTYGARLPRSTCVKKKTDSFFLVKKTDALLAREMKKKFVIQLRSRAYQLTCILTIIIIRTRITQIQTITFKILGAPTTLNSCTRIGPTIHIISRLNGKHYVFTRWIGIVVRSRLSAR